MIRMWTKFAQTQARLARAPPVGSPLRSFTGQFGRSAVAPSLSSILRGPSAGRQFSGSSPLANDTHNDNEKPTKIKLEPAEKPRYQLSFTCKVCSTRSTHEVSKQAYHKGTVLIQCPGCKNRHLIADHLKIFSDKSITLEDILAQQGETMEKRVQGQGEEDLEWEPEEQPKALS